mmetsp:Transcript_17089/g.26445  ORF Transcript_17089/g.26445 Transcript_17089/m.26445 type:complete len:145 (+) Transcript_17089:92-526(+)
MKKRFHRQREVLLYPIKSTFNFTACCSNTHTHVLNQIMNLTLFLWGSALELSDLLQSNMESPYTNNDQREGKIMPMTVPCLECKKMTKMLFKILSNYYGNHQKLPPSGFHVSGQMQTVGQREHLFMPVHNTGEPLPYCSTAVLT